jgi:hypothetical protein
MRKHLLSVLAVVAYPYLTVLLVLFWIVYLMFLR